VRWRWAIQLEGLHGWGLAADTRPTYYWMDMVHMVGCRNDEALRMHLKVTENILKPHPQGNDPSKLGLNYCIIFNK